MSDTPTVAPQTKQPSIRDLHVVAMTALFDEAKALAAESKQRKDVWKAHAKVNLPFVSSRTIGQMTRVYEAFKAEEEVIGNFEWDSLVALSAPRSDAARDQAIKEARAGRFVNAEQAKNLIALNRA